MDASAAGSEQQHEDTLTLAADSCVWREVQGEVIVLDKHTWSYLSVNGSGALLWKRLAEGATRTQLIEALREAYGIDEQSACRDIDEFISRLQGHELLRVGAA